MTADNLQRVHELTQRTNQMNFSGNRYELGQLEEILRRSDLCTYVLECCDRFGSYGIVGFSIVDAREPVMTDLMFSCRIQAKRVEHAFLTHVLRHYAADGGRDFFVRYRKTPRNAPSGKVFDDFAFEKLSETDGSPRTYTKRGARTLSAGLTATPRTFARYRALISNSSSGSVNPWTPNEPMSGNIIEPKE